jgi:hypothetical protein
MKIALSPCCTIGPIRLGTIIYGMLQPENHHGG